MKICKYCHKPISDNDVWNPDSEGDGYHHACLCEMELKSRDRQIYDKGRADVLNKIRAEIEAQREEVCKKHSEDEGLSNYYFGLNDGLKDARDIIDKYRASTGQDNIEEAQK